jgi:hypothetical protein
MSQQSKRPLTSTVIKRSDVGQVVPKHAGLEGNLKAQDNDLTNDIIAVSMIASRSIASVTYPSLPGDHSLRRQGQPSNMLQQAP